VNLTVSPPPGVGRAVTVPPWTVTAFLTIANHKVENGKDNKEYHYSEK
jgi:hypothetical protein